MNKICSSCSLERDAEHDFTWKYKERNIRNTKCKFCQSLVSKQHYQNKKQAYLERARTREIRITEDNHHKLTDYLSYHPEK